MMEDVLWCRFLVVFLRSGVLMPMPSCVLNVVQTCVWAFRCGVHVLFVYVTVLLCLHSYAKVTRRMEHAAHAHKLVLLCSYDLVL